MVPEAQWLESLFTNYDLYYLDPLIIKDALPDYLPPAERVRSQTSRLWGQVEKPVVVPWFQTDIEATSAVLAKVRQILRVDETNQEISQFLEDILPDLSEDRGRQKQIVETLVRGLRPAVQADPKASPMPPARGMARQVLDALVNAWRPATEPEKPTVHKYRIVNDLSDLDKKFGFFRQLPNRNMVDCLVALEGMITCVSTKDNLGLYRSVSVKQRYEDRYTRAVRFSLAERPGQLLAMDNWRIGLMVDQKGLEKTYPISFDGEDSVNAVALNGWYPFAKAIGFWRTDRGGRPFVDVLAILIKAFPSLDEILRQRAALDQTCFAQMLQNGKAKVDKTRQDLLSKPRYDPKEDYELVYPYFLATLCCRLNKCGWDKFETGERELYNFYKQYWQALVDLAKEIQAKKLPSCLPDFVKTEEKKRREAAQK
jgi:hypothetical protein